MSDEHDPYQLHADEFTQGDRSELAHFDCGKEEPWARAATEWLLGSDVWESMEKRGTKVWLYRTGSGVIVGFGSLGITRRRWPPPDGGYTNLLIIPMLGIDRRFQGEPPGQPSHSRWRYSNQILSHLRFEASKLFQARRGAGRNTLPLLTLNVHRENRRAMRLYERFGFVLEHSVSRGDLCLMVQKLQVDE